MHQATDIYAFLHDLYTCINIINYDHNNPNLTTVMFVVSETKLVKMVYMLYYLIKDNYV